MDTFRIEEQAPAPRPTGFGAAGFIVIAVLTCGVATGGTWLYKQYDSGTMEGWKKSAHPARWMFWAAGRDLDDELRNPKSVIPKMEPVRIPTIDPIDLSNSFSSGFPKGQFQSPKTVTPRNDAAKRRPMPDRPRNPSDSRVKRPIRPHQTN